MLFKKKLLFLSLVVILLLFSLTVSISAADKPIIIKLAHIDSTNIKEWGSFHNGALTFKRLVEARSEGRIKVEIYPSCQLGSERELFESLMLGTVQMTMCSTSPLTNWVPELMIFEIPYLFNNTEIALKVLDGKFGQEIKDFVIKKVGIRFIAYPYNGFRHFTNSVRPIRTPEDMKGLKIRVREDPVSMKIVTCLGASPTPISWGETYTSLQQGVVDGQENPITIIQDARFYEVQKYLTLDGHVFSIHPFEINEEFYQSLPGDLKRIVNESARDAVTAFRGLLEYGGAIGIQKLAEKGMEIYAPSAEDLAKFKAATQEPVKNFVIEKIGEKWVNKLIEAIKVAEEEYTAEIQ